MEIKPNQEKINQFLGAAPQPGRAKPEVKKAAEPLDKVVPAKTRPPKLLKPLALTPKRTLLKHALLPGLTWGFAALTALSALTSPLCSAPLSQSLNSGTKMEETLSQEQMPQSSPVMLAVLDSAKRENLPSSSLISLEKSRQPAKPEQPSQPSPSRGTVLDSAKPRVLISLEGNRDPAGHPVRLPGQKKWTVLIYASPGKDLESCMVRNLNTMEKYGSDENLNLVMQMDTHQGAKRYYVSRDEDPGRINSPVLRELGQVDMSSQQTLADFLAWGIQQYPSQYYLVILNAHGKGFQGAINDNNNNSSVMSADTIEGAFEKNPKKVDIIGFDSCLMGSVEVAQQLKDQAGFMVASQSVEYGPGWGYNEMLSRITDKLKGDGQLTPKEMAQTIVEASATQQRSINTLSALDLAKMEKLTQSIDDLAKAILDSSAPSDQIREAFADAQHFYYGYKDIYDGCRRLINDPQITDARLKEAANEVINKLQETIIAEQHSARAPDAHGLHIVDASTPSDAISSPKYQNLDFARQTHWDEAMQKLNQPEA